MAPRKERFQKRIRLLSGGYVKPDAFPNGEIVVYPWDTSTDDWLTERTKKGNQNMVLYDLCGQLCNLNGCPLESFVVGDVNTVLLVARSIRYNSVVQYEPVCPSCGDRTTDQMVVPDELGRIGEKASDYPGYDHITLPDSGDEVYIRPLTVRDERLIADRDEVSRKFMTDHVMHILTPVVAINEGKPDGYEEVLRWFNAISPLDAAYLETQQNLLYPHLDTDIPHKCDKCGKEFTHSLEFSREFFRPSVKPGKGATVPADVRPGNEQQKLDVKSE